MLQEFDKNGAPHTRAYEQEHGTVFILDPADEMHNAQKAFWQHESLKTSGEATMTLMFRVCQHIREVCEDDNKLVHPEEEHRLKFPSEDNREVVALRHRLKQAQLAQDPAHGREMQRIQNMLIEAFSNLPTTYPKCTTPTKTGK